MIINIITVALWMAMVYFLIRAGINMKKANEIQAITNPNNNNNNYKRIKVFDETITVNGQKIKITITINKTI